MASSCRSGELLVVGGGYAGICAALQGARLGLATVLLERETFLGGNGGPMLGVGATGCLNANPYYHEVGLVEELEARANFLGARQTPAAGVAYTINPLWDGVVADLLAEAGVTIYRRHLAWEVEVRERRIAAVRAVNLDNLDRVEFALADPGFVVDATGDAALAALAGADIRMGREGRDESGERSAPETADAVVSAASLTALVADVGRPSPFAAPVGTPVWNPEKPCWFAAGDPVQFLFQVDEGGESADNHPLHTPQALHAKLVRRLLSFWHHVKNVKYPEAARNHQLIWISPILGKRESRRALGDHTLTQTDIEARRSFPDAAGFGGHWLDEHLPSFDGGYAVRGHMGPYPYEIPLRSLYSRNRDNLFSAGRSIGVSHLAFTSTRVMRTGALLGQAVGVAAALCRELRCTPRQLAENHALRFQRALTANDVWIPGRRLDLSGTALEGARARADSEATLACAADRVANVTTAEAGAGVLLYAYPDRVRRARIWLENLASTARTVVATLSHGRSAPPVLLEPEAAVVASGFAHYFRRVDDVAVFTELARAEATVPPSFAGVVEFDFGAEVAIPRTGAFQEALRLSATGDAGVGTTAIGVDVHEGVFAGRIDGERVPVYDFGAPLAPGAAVNVLDGHIHREGRAHLHAWVSDPAAALPQTLTIELARAATLSGFALVFDTTEAHWNDTFVIRGERAARRLVADYRWQWTDAEGRLVAEGEVRDNHQRVNRHKWEKPVTATRLDLTVRRTWDAGQPARVYALEVFGK